MIDPKYTKPVASVISSEYEDVTSMSISGTSLQFIAADRTNLASKLGNYFSSFNLPARSNFVTTGGTLSLLNPELIQLNSDKIIIIKIPNTAYTEYLDARSLDLKIPINTPSGIQYWNIFSSTYASDTSLKYGEHSPLLGDNVAYLFSDNVNVPYSGMTTDEMGTLISHSSNTTWNPSVGYTARPSAVKYFEVQGNVNAINSDRRMRRRQSYKSPAGYPSFIGNAVDFVETDFSGGNLALYVPTDYNTFQVGDTITIDLDNITINPSHSGSCTITSISRNYNAVPSYITGGPYDFIVTDKSFGVASYLESGSIFKGSGAYYNYDIPLGFVCLDKGFVVLTHKEIVNNFAWSAGSSSNGISYSFSSSNVSLEFVNIDTVFKTTAVCMALNGEFYISNNPTWDRNAALSEFGSSKPIYITEIGLYNGLGELIGVSKFSEPVARYIDDLMTFYINMEM